MEVNVVESLRLSNLSKIKGMIRKYSAVLSSYGITYETAIRRFESYYGLYLVDWSLGQIVYLEHCLYEIAYTLRRGEPLELIGGIIPLVKEVKDETSSAVLV